MTVKKSVHMLAAAAALAIGTHAAIAAALGCQQDFPVPTPTNGNTCNANGKSATGKASLANGGGTTYRYSVKINAGDNQAFAILLKADGTQTKQQNGATCPPCFDYPPINSTFGAEQTCFNVAPAFSAAKIRIVVT